jgi:hypothetical protein
MYKVTLFLQDASKVPASVQILAEYEELPSREKALEIASMAFVRIKGKTVLNYRREDGKLHELFPLLRKDVYGVEIHKWDEEKSDYVGLESRLFVSSLTAKRKHIGIHVLSYCFPGRTTEQWKHAQHLLNTSRSPEQSPITALNAVADLLGLSFHKHKDDVYSAQGPSKEHNGIVYTAQDGFLFGPVAEHLP